MTDMAMLANRVRKNARHLGKWARREAVTCWRVYDRDIPEIPITVDTYEGALVINDYREFERDDAWLDAAVAAVRAGHVDLLERLASRVVDAVLAVDGRIAAVDVVVRKLRPPVPHDLATSGVRLVRRRAGT